jgi:lipoprotein-releasing system permease protein
VKAAGFEWFVAWRYLRTRRDQASIAPLVVGLAVLVWAATFIWLGQQEQPLPQFRFSVEPDWRRLALWTGVQTAFIGSFLALFGALWWRKARRNLLGEARPASLWPILGGLAMLVAGGVAVYLSLESGKKLPTLRMPGPLEALGHSFPRAVDKERWQAAGAWIGPILGALAFAATLTSLWKLRAGKRAGLYARELSRHAGARAPLLAAYLLALAGINWLVISERPELLLNAALKFAEIDWKRIYLAFALSFMVLGSWITIFGFFYVVMKSFFTTVSAFGVYLWVSALVISLSVMNGFEADLRQKILGASAHVLVSRENGAFGEWREVEPRVAAIDGVIGVTPYKQSEVVIVANSNNAGVIIKGIDPETVGKVTDLERNLTNNAKLGRMWPVLDDGGVGEYTRRPDGGVLDLSDAGPNEVEPDDAPIDLSGGGAAPPARDEEEGDEGLGPEDELELERAQPLEHLVEPVDPDAPIDLSGGGQPGSYRGAGKDLLDLDFGPIGELDPPPRAPGAERKLDARVADLDGLLVGRELAKNLHLYVGQEVQVVSPLPQDTPAGQVPRVRNFRIAGIFFSGMYEYDSKYAYVTLPALQSFLSLGDEIDGIEIKLADHDNTKPVLAALRGELGPAYRVQDWQEINRNLFSALKLEKIAMFLVLTIIILVASFSIISNLIMIVVEKAREVAILKALGAADRGVLRIFVIEGTLIGALGTSFGIAFGVLVCRALETYGLPLDPEVYYIDKLPVSMDPSAIGLVAIAGVAISFLATLYPSWVAARLRPVDGLRYE